MAGLFAHEFWEFVKSITKVNGQDQTIFAVSMLGRTNQRTHG